MEIKIPKRNIVLDLLRILAITEIFLMHLTLFIPEVEGDRVFAFMSKISSRGGNGVAILFCLSGYFICKELREQETDIKVYYKKRIKRIVPVYYMVLALYVAVGLLPLNIQISRYFLFVNAIVPSDNYALYNNMGAFWTMGCFMLWYILAPLLNKFVHDLKEASATFAVLFLIGQLLEPFWRMLYTYLNADAVDFMVGNNPFGNLYFFCAGVVTYYLIEEAKIMEGIFVSAAAITFLSVINSPWYMFWTFLTIIFILLSSEVDIRLPKGLEELSYFLSNISFDFYLVHMGIIRLFDRAGYRDAFGSLAFVLSATTVTFVVSVLVYGIDRKVLQRILRRF